MHKLFWDFDIQMDHLISARRPDLIIINKKGTCSIVDLAVKLKECKKRISTSTLLRNFKKLLKTKVGIIRNVIGALGTVTEGLVKRLEDLEKEDE